MQDWFQVGNVDEIESPALLLYVDRVDENIRRMLQTAGGPERLRSHIKTHKLPEIIRKEFKHGIEKFKCATIAEAEMVALCAAAESRNCDVLLAYQPVGPNRRRLCELIKTFPQTKLSVTVDDEQVTNALGGEAVRENVVIEVLLDIDCGQHRTGIEPGTSACKLYQTIHSTRGLKAGGLHAYDGHIHDRDPKDRAMACQKAFAPVAELRDQLLKAGLPVPRIVAGGTPTFPFHARRADVECSPGTCVLWDWGYSTNLPDLEFLHAAAVLTRVVSKPAPNRLCLDLGHKAIASEMPHPRVYLPELSDAKPVAHNEEHLVVETERAGEFQVGRVLYGIPWHICPTVALYSEAIAVRNSRAEDRWAITARARRLSI